MANSTLGYSLGQVLYISNKSVVPEMEKNMIKHGHLPKPSNGTRILKICWVLSEISRAGIISSALEDVDLKHCIVIFA